jgi:hypothetical protein
MAEADERWQGIESCIIDVPQKPNAYSVEFWPRADAPARGGAAPRMPLPRLVQIIVHEDEDGWLAIAAYRPPAEPIPGLDRKDFEQRALQIATDHHIRSGAGGGPRPEPGDVEATPGLPTEKDLRRLPLRAIVAYAARCAWRVKSLYRLPDDYPDKPRHEEAVDKAISAARYYAADQVFAGIIRSAFAAGDDAAAAADSAAGAAIAGDDAAAAADSARAAAAAARAAATAAAADRATVSSARMAADSAALSVAWIAHPPNMTPAETDRDARTCAAARADFHRLLDLDLGRFPEPGNPVDPSESGPLGPLWPDGAPEWYVRATEPVVVKVDTDSAAASESLAVEVHRESPLSLYFDLSEFAAPEIAEMIGLLSDLYAEVGGDRLVIEGMTLLDPAELPVPEGV